MNGEETHISSRLILGINPGPPPSLLLRLLILIHTLISHLPLLPLPFLSHFFFTRSGPFDSLNPHPTRLGCLLIQTKRHQPITLYTKPHILLISFPQRAPPIIIQLRVQDGNPLTSSLRIMPRYLSADASLMFRHVGIVSLCERGIVGHGIISCPLVE